MWKPIQNGNELSSKMLFSPFRMYESPLRGSSTLASCAFPSVFHWPWRLPLRSDSTQAPRRMKKRLWSKASRTNVLLCPPMLCTTKRRQDLRAPRNGEKPSWASSSLYCRCISLDLPYQLSSAMAPLRVPFGTWLSYRCPSSYVCNRVSDKLEQCADFPVEPDHISYNFHAYLRKVHQSSCQLEA